MGWENCLDKELPFLTALQVHAQSTHKNASNEEHMESDAYVYAKTTDY